MSDFSSWPSAAKIPRSEVERATRHLFLCIGPDCCDSAASESLWSLLKAESKKLSVPILRTKAACLRVCHDGPWLVVYPDGIWYGRIDEGRLLRILHQHVEGGRPVEEWVSARMSCPVLPDAISSSGGRRK